MAASAFLRFFVICIYAGRCARSRVSCLDAHGTINSYLESFMLSVPCIVAGDKSSLLGITLAMPLGFENTRTLCHECIGTNMIVFQTLEMSASYTVERLDIRSGSSFSLSHVLFSLPPVETAGKNGHYPSRYKRTLIINLYLSTSPHKSFPLRTSQVTPLYPSRFLAQSPSSLSSVEASLLRTIFLVCLVTLL